MTKKIIMPKLRPRKNGSGRGARNGLGRNTNACQKDGIGYGRGMGLGKGLGRKDNKNF